MKNINIAYTYIDWLNSHRTCFHYWKSSESTKLVCSEEKKATNKDRIVSAKLVILEIRSGTEWFSVSALQVPRGYMRYFYQPHAW